MKFLIFTLQEMTPEQLTMNTFRPIIKVNPNEEIDTNEGESTKDEEQSITSTELSEEISTSHTSTEIQKSQNLQKHLKLLLYSTIQYIMMMIHLKTNL